MKQRIKTACTPEVKDGRVVYYCGEGYSYYKVGPYRSRSCCAFEIQTKDGSGYCRYYGGEYGIADSRDWRNYRCFNPKAQEAALPRFIQRMLRLFTREKSKFDLL